MLQKKEKRIKATPVVVEVAAAVDVVAGVVADAEDVEVKLKIDLCNKEM